VRPTRALLLYLGQLGPALTAPAGYRTRDVNRNLANVVGVRARDPAQLAGIAAAGRT